MGPLKRVILPPRSVTHRAKGGGVEHLLFEGLLPSDSINHTKPMTFSEYITEQYNKISTEERKSIERTGRNPYTFLLDRIESGELKIRNNIGDVISNYQIAINTLRDHVLDGYDVHNLKAPELEPRRITRLRKAGRDLYKNNRGNPLNQWDLLESFNLESCPVKMVTTFEPNRTYPTFIGEKINLFSEKDRPAPVEKDSPKVITDDLRCFKEMIRSLLGEEGERRIILWYGYILNGLATRTYKSCDYILVLNRISNESFAEFLLYKLNNLLGESFYYDFKNNHLTTEGVSQRIRGKIFLHVEEFTTVERECEDLEKLKYLYGFKNSNLSIFTWRDEKYTRGRAPNVPISFVSVKRAPSGFTIKRMNDLFMKDEFRRDLIEYLQHCFLGSYK